MKITREWSMPSPDTFSIKPIAALAHRWLAGRAVIVDPFARNSKLGTITNDLSPDTTARYHMPAPEFLDMLLRDGMEMKVDAALLDPPYSPRQMSEAYQAVGVKCGMEETQNARLYSECKDRLQLLMKPGGIVITCGWNSNGMGLNRGFEIKEILLVPCGGAHNDYIVTVETKKDCFL